MAAKHVGTSDLKRETFNHSHQVWKFLMERILEFMNLHLLFLLNKMGFFLLVSSRDILAYMVINIGMERTYPLCRRCLNGNETVEHLVCECESLTISRGRIFGQSFGELRQLSHVPSNPYH